MDAPTYSLNQKLNINKNIYGNFHSFLYVSILVPFCPFSSRFFFCGLDMELFIDKHKWLSVDNQQNFCVWC